MCHHPFGSDTDRQRRRERSGIAARTLAGGLAVMLLIGLIPGCSCSKRPEWDSGLRNGRGKAPGPTAAANLGRDKGGAGQGGSGESGLGSGSGSGQTGAGRGAGGEADGGGGIAAGQGDQGAGSESGKGGEGSGGEGKAGAGDSGSPGGGSTPVGGTIAGNGSGTAAGTADDSSQPAAALPGRPRPRPTYDAATAVDVADKHLQRAARHKTAGDPGNAYAEAIEAFEAVEPHADTDDGCKRMLGRAKRMCEELAEIQNRKARPQPVPTLFE